MDKLYVIESGVRRTAEWKSCLRCDKQFLERLNKSRPKKYCSIECRGKALQNKLPALCAACDKSFYVTQSRKSASKSGILFCSMNCKNKMQRIGSGLAVDALPAHYGTGKRNRDVYRGIYRKAKKLDSLECERCGYCEFECGVDIHHIDSDSRNNDPQNLLALCSPCHRALHSGLWDLTPLIAGVAQFG